MSLVGGEFVESRGFAIVFRQTATALLVRGAPSTRTSSWILRTFSLDAFAGQTVHIRITAADGGADNLVEALVDDVRITRPN